MSNPSFENIDQWFFEYSEGNLSIAQESDFLDFLQENPELIGELKAWKLSKIRQNKETIVIPGLIKRNPLMTSKVLIPVSTVLILLLGGLSFMYFNPKEQYTSDYIYTETLKPHQLNLLKRNNLNINEENNNINITTNYSHSHTTTNETHELNTTLTHYQEDGKSHTTHYANRYTLSNFETQADGDESRLNGDFQTPFVGGNYLKYQSEDLHDVLAFLPTYEDEESISESNMNELTERAENTQSSSSTKSSSKSFFAVASNKIKRMLNQPTALRNTKSPHYHTPMMTGFKPNFGMVGSSYGNRLETTSRVQWLNKTNSQIQNTISWDGYLYALKGGVGIDLNFDTYNTGAINNYHVGLTYSPKFSLSKNISFEPALRFKMGMIDIQKPENLIGTRIEFNRHNVLPFFENDIETTGRKLWYKDIGLGFMLNTKAFYVGFNADNLAQHENNFYSSDLSKKYKEKIHYTAIMGTEYQSLTKDISVNAYALFQSYGSLDELWLGANMQYKWFHFGGGISTKADFGASVAFNIKRVTIHYNIDYTKSLLLDRKGLSHQVSMKIMLKPHRQNTKFLSF